jgi:Domain of unknown function (DUF4291)
MTNLSSSALELCKTQSIACVRGRHDPDVELMQNTCDLFDLLGVRFEELSRPLQHRILAIDIAHDGFNWALAHSCPSERPHGLDDEGWQRLKQASPVRIQWDPERDFHFTPLPHRTIQIGLSGEAVRLYVHDWIKAITDVTAFAHDICADVKAGALDRARSKLPVERVYEAAAVV